ncbi:MAG: hypothetical protein AB4426_03045 [Xenococcaceae cyanobacterium]
MFPDFSGQCPPYKSDRTVSVGTHMGSASTNPLSQPNSMIIGETAITSTPNLEL